MHWDSLHPGDKDKVRAEGQVGRGARSGRVGPSRAEWGRGLSRAGSGRVGPSRRAG